MKKKPSSPSPPPAASTPTPPPPEGTGGGLVEPASATVGLVNRSGQLITFTLIDAQGAQHHRELQAGESMRIPQSSYYGPDVAAKLRSKHLTLLQ